MPWVGTTRPACAGCARSLSRGCEQGSLPPQGLSSLAGDTHPPLWHLVSIRCRVPQAPTPWPQQHPGCPIFPPRAPAPPPALDSLCTPPSCFHFGRDGRLNLAPPSWGYGPHACCVGTVPPSSTQHPLGGSKCCLPGTGSSASSCSQPPLGPCCCMEGAPSGPPQLPAQLSLVSLLPYWGISCGIHLPVFLTPRMLLTAMGAMQHLPPTVQPKIAAFKQVLWFLMACFCCQGVNHLPLPSIAALLPWVLAPLFTPAPSKWRCLQLCFYLPGAWVAHREATLAAPRHHLPPRCDCHLAGGGIRYGPLRCGAGSGVPQAVPGSGMQGMMCSPPWIRAMRGG